MVQIRELSLDDYPAIKALNERNGLRTPAEVDWARLWAEHPQAEQFHDVPHGWVMEDGRQQIVGAAGNVPVMYDFGGRSIRASAGMAWVVDAAHRNASPLIFQAFFTQRTVDLLINTTANPVAGKIWETFRADRLPCASYDRNLLWITSYQSFAKAATRRLGWRGASFLQIPVAGCLAGQDVWRRLNAFATRHHQTGPTVTRLNKFDHRFDTLWDDVRTQGNNRLRAVRDAKSLEWHFGPCRKREEAVIFGCPAADSDSLDGYLIAQRNDRLDISLRRYRVADLQVRPGRAEVIPRLIAAALQFARSEKAAAVELTGFEPAKHRLAETIPHRVRQLDTWPFFFRCRDNALRSKLRDPESWDPSPFDGDATL